MGYFTMNILRHGYRQTPDNIVYYKKCSTCGCEFTYQLSDIRCAYCGTDDVSKVVYCPECAYTNIIWFKIKYKEKKHGKRI